METYIIQRETKEIKALREGMDVGFGPYRDISYGRGVWGRELADA